MIWDDDLPDTRMADGSEIVGKKCGTDVYIAIDDFIECIYRSE